MCVCVCVCLCVQTTKTQQYIDCTGLGGRQAGMRALLLISRCAFAEVSASALMLTEGIERLSGVRPQLWSGIYQFDVSSPRDGITPGRMREILRGSSAMKKSEQHMIQVLVVCLIY